MTARIRYIATVRRARELGLVGTTDLAFWAERLAPEGLEPIPEGGRATVLVTTVSGRWRAIGYRDFSVCVAARAPEHADLPHGWFMARAFNSSRIFAFFERHWFGTPYSHRSDLVHDIEALSFRFGNDFTARADVGALGAVATTPESWAGPLFIPSRDGGDRRHFFVRFEGDTAMFPFEDGRDSHTLDPDGVDDVFRALVDSDFTPTTWVVRASTTHARGETLSR